MLFFYLTINASHSKKNFNTKKSRITQMCYQNKPCCSKSNDSNSEVYYINYSSRNSRKNKDKNIFLKKLEEYLFENYGTEWNDQSKDVFSYFYDHFESDDNLRIMCLAYMIFATTGFTEMENKSNFKYHGRGFLQIETLSNYKLISDEECNYVQNPDELKKFNIRNMMAALKIFDIFTSEDCESFNDILYALKPNDVNIKAKNKKYMKKIYENRLEVYVQLCDLFGVEKIIGQRKFFE
ncbi:hypothetical protein DMUE_1459 [Dictyocoela muelleri]|nr:hypothetical protein DMUE_1459 [Dictyocoela muelleri]